MQDKTTFELWMEGDLDADSALQTLCEMLNSNADRLEPLQETEKILRGQISQIVEYKGGKVDLEGFGNLMITGASVTTSYPAKDVDALVAKLAGMEGYEWVAKELSGMRKESARAGGVAD